MIRKDLNGSCLQSPVEDLEIESCSLNYQRLETVLVIEDQEDLSRALSLRLQAAGLNVACAYDGIAGLEKIHRLEPDLIVLDLRLPRLHGFKLLHAVRSQRLLAEAPIIVMTGDSDPQIQVRADRWGIRRVFRKPVALRKVVDEVLSILNEN